MGTGGPFPGAKARTGRDADHSPHLVPGRERVGAIPLLPPSASLACSGTTLALAFNYLKASMCIIPRGRLLRSLKF
jgi:hypothetical protein